jgi:hypothetical protein
LNKIYRDFRHITMKQARNPEQELDESSPKPSRTLRQGWTILDPERYSVGIPWNGLKRLTRIMGYIIRFVRNLIFSVFHGKKKEELPYYLRCNLLPGELSIAKKRLIRISQRRSFPEEVKLLQGKENRPLLGLPNSSRLRKFTPFIDEQGVLRCQGRLEKADIYGFDVIYPIILDRNDQLTRLIVAEKHFELAHPVGHNAVKAAVQSEYVVIGLGTLLGTIKWKCVICQRNNSKPACQIQAPLPARRSGNDYLRPFTDVGLDYAGPFNIIVGRGQRRKKIYILVFTCLAIRAVHFEPTGGMETQHVINAISRFADIRGVPVSITSDNQTSFVKADSDLSNWIRGLNFNEIVKTTSDYRKRGIKWIFNPPMAPHFGGVYEIIVKAAKRALYSTVGEADLNEEEFRTATSKITWMLNQRPIQKTGDENDWQTLTPNHFLNCPDEATFPPELPQGRSALQERLRYQIEVQAHFWHRFQKELVPLLSPRSKWFQRKENLEVGDLVVEIDEKSQRGKWKMARISAVHPSDDAFIRSVDITDAENRKFTRPICKLIPLRL